MAHLPTYRRSLALLVIVLVAAQAAITSPHSTSAAPAGIKHPEKVSFSDGGLGGHVLLNVGEHLSLKATGKHLAKGDQVVIREVTGGQRTALQSCSQKCSHSVRSSSAGTQTFKAVVISPSGQVLTASSAITVEWKHLTIVLHASDTLHTIDGSNTELAGVQVTVSAQTPEGVSELWKSVRITDTGTGAVKASCSPNGACSFQVREFAGTAASTLETVRHTYEGAALDTGGSTLLRSTQVTVSWRPWIVNLAASAPLSGTNLVVGSTDPVNLQTGEEASTSAAGLVVSIFEAGGSKIEDAPCGGDLRCDANVLPPPVRGTHSYIAVVTDGSGQNVAGASNPVKIHWCPAGAHGGACDELHASVSVDKTDVPAGARVIVTGRTEETLAESGGYHMVISDDKGNTQQCPANSDDCTWDVSENSPTDRTFTVSVKAPDGSSAGPESDGEKVIWNAWEVVSLTPSTQTVNTGKEATLKATLNYPLLPGYTAKIFEDNGNESPASSSGPTLTWAAKEGVDGTHTFHVEIFDQSGTRVDDNGDGITAKVTWKIAWNGSVEIAVDNNNTNPSVGTTATIRATIKGDKLDDTGFTLVIKRDDGTTWNVKTGTVLTQPETFNTDTEHTYTAYVLDDSGTTHAADAPNPAKVHWSQWTITLETVNQNPPLPEKKDTTNSNTYTFPSGVGSVQFFASAGNPTGLSLDVAGLQVKMTVDGTDAPNTPCTTGNRCDGSVGSSGTHHIEAWVYDPKAGKDVSPHATMTISFVDWGVQASWDANTVAKNYNLCPKCGATATYSTGFGLAGTAFNLKILSNNTTFQDETCTPQPAEGQQCQVTYTANSGGKSIFPSVGVYGPSGLVSSQVRLTTVHWGLPFCSGGAAVRVASSRPGAASRIQHLASECDPCPSGQDACLTLNQNEGDDYTKVTATWYDDLAPSGSQATFSWDGSAYNPTPMDDFGLASLDINLNGGQVYGSHTVAVNDGSYNSTANYYIDICPYGVSVCLYDGNCSTGVVSCIYNPSSTSFAVNDTVYGYYQDKTCAGGNEDTIDYGPSGPRDLGSETLSSIGTAYGYWSAQDPGSHTIVTSDNCAAPRQATYSVFGTPLSSLTRSLLGFAPRSGIAPLLQRSAGSKPPALAVWRFSSPHLTGRLARARTVSVKGVISNRRLSVRLVDVVDDRPTVVERFAIEHLPAGSLVNDR